MKLTSNIIPLLCSAQKKEMIVFQRQNCIMVSLAYS